MTDADKRYQAKMMVKEHGGIVNTIASGHKHSVAASLVVATEILGYTLPFANLYEFLNSAWASQLTTNAW